MRRTFAATLLLALAACSSGGGPPRRVVGLFGGDSGWAAIDAPEKVTAWRVIRPGVLKYIRAPDLIAGYEIISTPVAVDAATAGELRTILADDSTYDWERAKGCEFDPGVALRFEKAATSVDVLVCFQCSELAAFDGATRVGTEDFDAARPRLLAVAKRLFPGDEQIQALK